MASSKQGCVYLVGGGPGDPGLISLKGLRCLQAADFILYDGLVNPLILRHTRAQAERTARADESGQRILHQHEINQRLIDEARQGKTVVRLKGGDPYIFGRGSEEAEALVAAGIPFEVVPGITAATAAAAYAGFSLTHRDHASAVCLITGHEDPTKPHSLLDYSLLARFPGTLVFYMGLHRLPRIVHALIAAGMSPETPAAIITRASTPAQKVVTDTLAQLPAHRQDPGLRPPSLIIVGECINLRQRIQWFDNKPLFGLRIGITRPAHQAEPQILQLLDSGAEPVLMPLIEIVPPAATPLIDQMLDRLHEFSWIVFTSANGVQALLQRMWERGLDSRALAACRLACIGPSTAEALLQFHLRADLIPEPYCSEALADALIAQGIPGKVLWARANRGRDALPERLQQAGIPLEEVVVYEHRDLPDFSSHVAEELNSGTLDWVCLSSPAIAEQFARLMQRTPEQRLHPRTRLVAISPITAEAARAVGLPIHATARDYTWNGMFNAIEENLAPA
ncbi:MAG: uroporphyrinogen-III C-methyltransferase [Planctomycetaceae bacterium]